MTEHRKRLLIDGLVGGLVGYGAVVATFIAYDVVSGRPLFHTAALLGEALLGVPADGGLVAGAVDPGIVLAFNGLHLGAVLLFAYLSGWLVYEAELHPDFWYVSLVMFLAATILGFGGVLAVTVMLGVVLSPWLVAVTAVLGALAVAAWLLGGHWSLVRFIRDSRLSDVAIE